MKKLRFVFSFIIFAFCILKLTSVLLFAQIDPPAFSHEAGFYNSPVTLSLIHPNESVQIFYTTDGSIPDAESTLYTGPLTISDRTNEPNNLSIIPTNFVSDPFRSWTPPSQEIPKGTVIRAVAILGNESSDSVTKTYFVFPDGRASYTLPVVSLTADSTAFFGFEDGIYVPGINYEEGNDATGNYVMRGIEWERNTHFELFEPGSVLGQDLSFSLGVRIHGGFTRRFPQKSIRLYSRSDYGQSRFNYPVFPESPDIEYNRLILRNSGNDNSLTMFRDAAAQMLVRHLNLDTQAYRPAEVFLNGEYWGIHNFRERQDRFYLSRVYGVNEEDIDLLTRRNTVVEGTNEQYNEVVRYIDETDMSVSSSFSQVETLIDLDNFLDYYSAQVYYGNSDWPHNNIDFWRTRTAYNPNAPKGLDGRWRWLLYDVDRSLGLVTDEEFDMVHFITRPVNPVTGEEWPNLILRNLLENESFYNRFVNRIADHLNTAFRPERVSTVVDSLKTPLQNVIERHSERWVNMGNVSNWEARIQQMHDYAAVRPGFVRSHVSDNLGAGEHIWVTLDVSEPESGKVQINSTLLLPGSPGVGEFPYPWSGVYFSEVPVRLRAVAQPGFTFSHWQTNATVDPWTDLSKPVIDVLLREDSEFTAYFVPSDEPVATTLYYWLFDNSLPNNTALEEIEPVLWVNERATLAYLAAVSEYPPQDGSGEGILDRVNDPTSLNYREELNQGIRFEDFDMRGIRARNPSLEEGMKSAIVLATPTTGFDADFELRFAARRTPNGQEELLIEYQTSPDSEWTTSGLRQSRFVLSQIFNEIVAILPGNENINNNPDLKLRIRFAGSEEIRQGFQGNVRFNNISFSEYLPGQINPPEEVVTFRPSNGETGTSLIPVFSWEAKKTAENYRLQINNRNEFDESATEIIIQHQNNETENQVYKTLPDRLEEFTEYYWRIRAENNAGPSPWSPVSSFTTGEQQSDEAFDTQLVNFPNPFSSVTTIEFVLETDSHAKLSVYTLTGQLVSVLLDDFSQQGVYRLEFDGTGVSSGLYFYQLQTNSGTQNGQMMLIK